MEEMNTVTKDVNEYELMEALRRKEPEPEPDYSTLFGKGVVQESSGSTFNDTTLKEVWGESLEGLRKSNS